MIYKIPMNNAKGLISQGWPLICVTLVLLLIPTSSYCQGKKKGQEPSPVQVAEARIREVRPQLTLIGNVEAFTEGDAHTEVRGLVEEFPVEEGDYLERGGLIARLDSSQLNLELERMRQEREQNRVLMEKEQKELKRFEMLQKSKSVSAQDLDREFSEAQSARHRYNMLDAAVRLLEDRLAKKTIRAPFSGYIVKERAHVGKWLQEGSNVVRMVQVDPIFVTTQFPQGHMHEIKTGDFVTVNPAGLPNNKLKGVISAIVPKGDESSRTFPVKSLLENKEHTLKPGMLTYVTFGLGKARKALTVPKDAVITTPEQQRVIFVVDDGVAVKKRIELGDASGDYVEIKGQDLEPGVKVVTVGNERLRPGQPVKIMNKGGKRQAGIQDRSAESRE